MVSIAVVLILFFTLYYGAYLRPQLEERRVGDIWANYQLPRVAKFLTPFYIRVDVRNLHPSLSSGDIVFRVEGEIVGNCEFVAAYPLPYRVTRSREAVHCFYEPIAPGRWLIVEIGFKPLHVGEFSGKLIIFQAGQRVYNLPLKVNVAP